MRWRLSLSLPSLPDKTAYHRDWRDGLMPFPPRPSNGLESRTMKSTKLAIFVAVACGVPASLVYAQGQSRPFTPSAYEYGNYDYYNTAQPTPAPAPGAAPAPAPAPAPSCN